MTNLAIRTIVVCSAALLAAGGCAHTGGSPTLSSRLVRGRPAAPAAKTTPQPDMEAWIAEMREIQATAKPPARAVPLTAEKADPDLGAALARLGASATSANHVAVALAYYRAGVLDIAQDHLGEAVRRDPSDAAAFDLRARIWRDWGFAGSALPDAHRAVYFAPRSPEARNTLGTVFFALGRLPDARASYVRATELDPRAGYAWSNVCRVALLEGDLAGAERACRRALAIDSRQTQASKDLERIRALAAAPDADGGRRP